MSWLRWSVAPQVGQAMGARVGRGGLSSGEPGRCRIHLGTSVTAATASVPAGTPSKATSLTDVAGSVPAGRWRQDAVLDRPHVQVAARWRGPSDVGVLGPDPAQVGLHGLRVHAGPAGDGGQQVVAGGVRGEDVELALRELRTAVGLLRPA